MRLISSILLAFSLTINAQQQKPLGESLQSWFNKAKSYIPSAATSPIASTAAKTAAANVVSLTNSNWESVLSPSSSDQAHGVETWMVFFSGGNKTCYGRCGRAEKAWNESVAVLAADPSSPQLAYVNCDKQPVLCATWSTPVPTIWHIQLPVPAKDQSRPATTIHIVGLNTTTVTAKKVAEILSAKKFQDVPVYEGALHPFDGWVARYKLSKPLGYVMFTFANIPSWAFMIVISMVSRQMM
ncbi:MAG: hypothetical protein LQ342_004595 [Letrouitia transgressa]|nr:MAG: hypothetical protein LQ342_004595 [Letrouitia transgressa]